MYVKKRLLCCVGFEVCCFGEGSEYVIIGFGLLECVDDWVIFFVDNFVVLVLSFWVDWFID